MQRMTIEMPPVTACDVTECVYNIDDDCHARAITVGDGVAPNCDTYMGSANHTHQRGLMAGVGACKVSGCIHNDDFECVADNINVGHQGTAVNCLTFRPR